MADTNEFQDLMRQTGVELSGRGMSEALGIGQPYASDLWNGNHPISKPIRAKLKALIAAKANGAPEFVEQVEVDLPKPLIEPRKELRYQLLPGVDKYRIIEVIAVVPDADQAHRLCDLLNKESG